MSTESAKPVGLFGGTFDPVHNGHLFLALEAVHRAGLEQMVFLPNNRPPHKDAPKVTAEQRYQMVSAAISGVPELTVSRLELDREGRSYTYDTLSSFSDDLKLVFLCGADAFQADWYRLPEVIERLDRLIIANRSGYPFRMPPQLEQLPACLLSKIELMTFPDIAISSSDIRQRIANGRPFRFLIPEPVYRIITELGLYTDLKCPTQTSE